LSLKFKDWPLYKLKTKSTEIRFIILQRKKKAVKDENENLSTSSILSLNNSLKFENDMKPFILAVSSSPVRIFIPSKKSLENLSQANSIHLDVTHKLILYNFPVIVYTVYRCGFLCCEVAKSSNEEFKS
jgi:hypothetical protein